MIALSDNAVERLRAVANWPEFTSDRYTVTEQIGRGGMGTVYAAVDTSLGRNVAIKVSNAVASTAIEERLASEARILARLEHPGIVPVHDVGRLADGRLFYVMKRVQGTTLDRMVPAGPGLAESLRIFERICEAVACAHAHGIVHRDLKPSNVMVGSFGEVMVMDWGVAKTHDEDGTGSVVGTRGFMAPEQAAGADVDARADVYSLGAILKTLLAGARVPPPLRSICARALATDPKGRYESASALAADVSRFRSGHAVQAHRETPIERAFRVARMYRTPILLVLTYMIMRALAAFFAGW